MTKTNSLKKALAGILAACMAATTLVAAPFTLGGSQSVGAVGLDEMELLAQYSFESGYTDSVSGEAGTLDETAEGTVTLQKEDDNTYMSVGSSGNYNNVLAVANPYAGDTASAMTIAMMPLTGLILPSSPSSPTAAKGSVDFKSVSPYAPNTARAIGKS